jgi:serine/threonine protein kinase
MTQSDLDLKEFETDSEEIPILNLDEHYKLYGLIGEGNYGSVYEAIDLESSKTVAIKLFVPDEYFGVYELHREFSLMKDISRDPHCHPGIICYHKIFINSKDNRIALVMDYVQGYDLDEYINILKRTSETISPQIMKGIMIQLLSILKYLHSKKLVQRDIKPANIMCGKDGFITLIDFGFSCYFSDQVSDQLRCNKIQGSDYYMSPDLFEIDQNKKPYDITLEQAKSDDIWALGLVFFELTHKKDIDIENSCKHEPSSYTDKNINKIIDAMLSCPWKKRITASDAYKMLEYVK